MADQGRVHFTPELVERWLEEANGGRRAPWARWPNATHLAGELSRWVHGWVEPTPQHIVVRQVGQLAGQLRKLAAAIDDPALVPRARNRILCGAGLALSTVQPGYANFRDGDRAIAEGRVMRTLCADPSKLGSLLRLAADTAEEHLERHVTKADQLWSIYRTAARALAEHTWSSPSIRPTSPDARFVRSVLEHVGVPWRPRIWRYYAEGEAAVLRGEITEDDLEDFFGRIPRMPAKRVKSLREKAAEWHAKRVKTPQEK